MKPNHRVYWTVGMCLFATDRGDRHGDGQPGEGGTDRRPN